MRVLLTRPGSRIAATAARLREMGLEVVESPVLAISPSGAPMPAGRFDAILMTSPGSLLGFPEAPEHLPVLAVGDRTAGDARRAGFLHVLSASGDRKDLAQLARETLPPGSRLLLAAGRERKEDLVDMLRAAGHEPVVWVCYHADAASALSDAAVAELRNGRIDYIMHYSPRSAALLLQLAGKAGASAHVRRAGHVCISGDTADVLAAAGITSIAIAGRPDDDGMIASMAALLPAHGS